MASNLLLEEKLSTRFNEFLQTTRDDMGDLISLQEEKNAERMKSLKDRMQGIINNKEKNIEDLIADIKRIKHLEQERTKRLYSVFTQD